MNLHYISPSILPSRSANSVHVIMQCEALAQLGVHVTLYAKRASPDLQATLEELYDAYGVDFSRSGIELVSYFNHCTKAVNFRIAVMALKHLFLKYWLKGKKAVILSRNLYASFFLGVILRMPMMFETHQLETGFRKTLQRVLICAPWVTTIVISQKLVECLQQKYGCSVANPLVLHDAAAAGIEPCGDGVDRHVLIYEMLPTVGGKWDAICGYFGHLYSGRGIEIIEQMAVERPKLLFLVIGGNPDDVDARKAARKSRNIVYVGHLPYPAAQKIMKLVDVLLMPYQESVSIGVTGHDTAKWMSPMKMFEYLASGVPVISSALPALQEILQDGKNCLLVPPSCHESWLRALDRLLADPVLANSLGAEGHKQYLREHTWIQRARQIVEAISV